MKNLNELYYPTNEKDMRFEALQMLRQTQAALTEINFLEVISLMRPENPHKKTILQFEEDLNDLTNRIGAFIQEAKNDVEYEGEEEPEEPEDKKDKEVKERIVDSSESSV
jgi:hypothetical protein